MSVRNNEIASSKEVWIGLALVKQPKRNGALGDADRAYVNVLALAINGSDFRAQVREALKELRLTLIKLEDAETMKSRLSKHSVHRDLRNLAEEVELRGSPQFDIFQSFDMKSKGK